MVTDTETEVGGQRSAVSPDPEPAQPGPQHGATPAGAAKHRFRIAFDVVAQATAQLPDADREALRWVAQFGRSKNVSVDEIATRLRKPEGGVYSGDSLYQALTGRREPEQLKNLVAAIAKLREVEEARAGQVETGFIETAISRRVFAACRKAFLRRKIVFIWGESQIGKTTALREYQRRHNHGETIYVRMPTGGSLDAFFGELAVVLGLPSSNRAGDLRRRLLECFDDRMLLVVDETHECLSEHYSVKRGLRTLNFIRELQEKCRCGVVLSATNVFRDAIQRGPHARNLRQLWFRGMAPCQLSDRPSEGDLELFAKAYGLGPAPEEAVAVRVTVIDDKGRETKPTVTLSPLALQTEIVRDFGLGRWNMILQEASDLAHEKKKPIGWGAVISAWHAFDHFSAADSEGGAL